LNIEVEENEEATASGLASSVFASSLFFQIETPRRGERRGLRGAKVEGLQEAFISTLKKLRAFLRALCIFAFR
jgi:hypothetical protein